MSNEAREVQAWFGGKALSFRLARAAIALAAASLAGAPANAHTDDYFDSLKSPHGGQMRMSGPYHFELVASPGSIVVYVSDHANNTIMTAGAKGVATVTTDHRSQKAALLPAGGNMLAATGEFNLAPGTVITLSIGLADEPTATATFRPVSKSSVTKSPVKSPAAPSRGTP